ncbi:MAG: sulfite exporter TauE/SafE family protein [Bdellovibrionota bacterium]
MIPVTVFIAGFLASPHCAAMCGPLVMTFGRGTKRMVCYQLGRMTTYAGAGALAGWVGQGTLKSNSPVVTAAALALFTILLILVSLRYFGIGSLHLSSSRQNKKTPSISLNSLLMGTWRRLLKVNLNPQTSSYFAGALTVLLPCAHLYFFILGASATGSVLGGTAFMIAFWLSTLPALGLAPMAIRQLLKKTSVRTQRIALGAAILASLVSLVTFGWQLRVPPEKAAVHHHHH